MARRGWKNFLHNECGNCKLNPCSEKTKRIAFHLDIGSNTCKDKKKKYTPTLLDSIKETN